MAFFTDEQKRDIREHVFTLEADKRFKILQCVGILQADGEDEDTLVSTMYQMASNSKELDRIHNALVNSSLVTGAAFEVEKKLNPKEG
jgi:hypothetical protein